VVRELFAVTGIRINRNIVIPNAELSESFVRSTGPGGQNVNKLSTKVELRWTPSSSSAFSDAQRQYLLQRLAHRLIESGELIIVADEHRTQGRNRDEARKKLALVVRQAMVRPKKRRPTKPSRASVKRRLDGKKRRSSTKKNRAKARLDD
jgi:ribosome-associated protein